DTIPDQTYSGSEICPEISVKDGETTLILGTDYTVECANNVSAGTANMTITGMGDYPGSISKAFEILKAPLTITARNKTIAYGDEPANDGVEYAGFAGEENASVLGGTLTYGYNYEKGNKTGEYTITPSGLTADNYEINFVSGTLTVEPKKTDFAAVQILEDENGARAIIDGEYTADNAAVNIPENIEVASVDFTRSFTPDVFATVTFPFEVNTSCLTGIDSIIEFQGITADYEVDFGVIWKKTETGEQTHITLQPYHPYMISMNSTKLGINCQDQEHTSLTLKATSEEAAEDIVQRYGNWIFTGTLAYKQWQAGDPDLTPTRVVYGYAAEADGKYGVGAFVRIGSDASISPFRAYIKYSPLPQMSNKPAPAPAGVMMANSAVSGNATAGIDNLPESMDVVITSKDENGNEHTTVIGSINTRTGEIRFNRRTADRWFDMQGRVLQGKPTVKGRYLHNGKVEIVK
uniref:MBG domain-containing protein n=1 Tax=Fibrobacter sp. TaxID=35828 RepID=UPI00386F32A8